MQKINNYIPDSIYTICGEYTEDCSVCSNDVYSPVVNNYVHDSQRGKVFCPFGKKNTMNQSIYSDQLSLHSNDYYHTRFGHAPQLNPRPLSKIGLEWRTS
jgi:hypothetical protein